MDFTLDELFTFIDKAGKATYAGGGTYAEPERSGFKELTFTKGNFTYRDSYAGFYRSRGTEVVRHKDIPIWASLYGGGMVAGFESLAGDTFTFLKQVMLHDEAGFDSFRGPHKYSEGEWEYVYSQEGDVSEFTGYEEIRYKADVVFTHRIMGGFIVDKYNYETL